MRFKSSQSNRRSLWITIEDDLKQPGQLLARWTIGPLVSVAHHFLWIEHIHSNVHVDLIGQTTRSIELNENGGCHVPQIVNAELLNGRSIVAFQSPAKLGERSVPKRGSVGSVSLARVTRRYCVSVLTLPNSDSGS